MMLRLTRRRVLILALHLAMIALLAGLIWHVAPTEAQSESSSGGNVTITGATNVDVGQQVTYTCTGQAGSGGLVAMRGFGQDWSSLNATSSIAGSWNTAGEETIECRSINSFPNAAHSITVTVGFTGPPTTVDAGDGITEGGNATFTITMNPAPSEAVTVSVTIEQTGSYVASQNLGAKDVTVSTSGSATHTVPTINDNADEANGAVTLTIVGGVGYTVGDTASASVAVLDNDVPLVTIAGGSAVTEGENATFTLSASPTPYQAITVNLTIAQTGAYVDADDIGTGKTVTIPATGSANYQVAIVDDDVNEAAGSVAATVTTGTGYSPGSVNSATVNVADDDTPVVSAVSDGPVYEGNDSVFTLTAVPVPYQAITVNLTIGQTGAYVDGGDIGSDTVSIPVAGTATYRVSTVNDEVTEANGTVTLTVNGGSGYTAGTGATGRVLDDDIPTVSISGDGSVVEGNPADFTLTATPAPSSPLAVTILVVQTGEYVDSSRIGQQTVVITSSGILAYSVPTINDNANEAPGSVSVAISEGVSYNVGLNTVASYTVNDNDLLNPPGVNVVAALTSSVELAWNNPPGPQGTGYELQYRVTTATDWTSWDLTDGRTLTGLLPNTEYSVRVRAIGDADPSQWSAVVSATTLTGPDAPLLQVVRRDGGTIVVNWSAPNARGTTIQRYGLRYRKSSSTANWNTASYPSASGQATLSQLEPDTEYRIEVRAVPNVGVGAWGTLTAATTASPRKVEYLAFSTANTASATLIWDPPYSGGYAITRYDLRYRVTQATPPEWTTVGNITPSANPTRRITGLDAGTPYEAQVRGVNSQGIGPWSATLYFDTNAGLFTESPPGNLVVKNLAQSPNRIVVGAEWEKVLDATGYQVDLMAGGKRQIIDADDTHLEIVYEIPGDDANGVVRLSVRALLVQGEETTYSPWSPEVPLAYFGESTIPVVPVLGAAIAGTGETSQGVADTRTTLAEAVIEVAGPSGFEPDTQGILDFLSVLPAMIIVGMGAYAGMKFRALGLALGVASVIAVMSMFATSSVFGLDVIWPMLGLFGLIAFGVISFIRKYRISTPVVLYAVLFGALHIAAIFTQNVAGFSLSGSADYGESIWAGTPVDDLLAIRKLDSYFDLRELFTAMGDMLVGLFSLAVFDYAAFQGQTGAALWFTALIKLVLSLSSSALLLTIIRQLFSTGIFNSAAGLALVVGGVGTAAIVSSVVGGATGTPQVAIAAAAQGAQVEEGNPVVFVISAEPEPEQPLVVSITVAQTGSYVPASSIGNRTVTIPTSGEAQFTIPTEDDTGGTAAGRVTVTVSDGDDYDVREPTSATVTVRPDDAYKVSVAPASPGEVVEEGNLASFTISSDPRPQEPLVVSVTVAQTGGYVTSANLGSKSVSIPTTGRATYSVPTEVVAGSTSGSVSVTVNAGSDYETVAPTSASVTVTPDLPTVTITAASTTVDDDAGPARFTLRTFPALTTSLTVNVRVTEVLVGNGTNHVASGNRGSKTVTIPAGGIGQYSVPLTNGTGNSQLIVTVTSGSGYEVGNPSAALTVVTP